MSSELSAGEVLGLRFGPNGNACALQPLVEQLLGLINQKASEADVSEKAGQLRHQLEDLAKSLINRRTREAALKLTPPILALCTQLLDAAARSSAAKEVAEAVALVRDAVSSIAGGELALKESLLGTAGRFDALRQVNDLERLKAGLANEVKTLKDIAATRERDWQRQMAMVERRMQTLEHRLSETRLEVARDKLTGLVNRGVVETAFQDFSQARRRFVMALFDVDDFKHINDTWGHLAGDSALKVVAKSLQSSVRSDDVVGRFGGDEFVLIMLDVSLAQAEHRLRALLNSLRATIDTPLGQPKVTVTCGASDYTGGDTFESLLERADKALYEMKRVGKNRLGVKSAPGAH